MVIGHVSTNLEKVWMHRWRRFFLQSLKCLAVLGGQEKLAGWLKKWGDCSFFIELYKIYCMFVQYIFSKVKLTDKSP